MSIWVRITINTALGTVASLLQASATTPAHKEKLARFLADGQDLLNNW